MTLRIGDPAPDFSADTTAGPIDFHRWADGAWVYFFSHPADFTPVCTTELGRTAQLTDEFARRGVKPLGLSTDSLTRHVQWIDDVETTQRTRLDFPIVADPNLAIAKLYSMIHPEQSVTAPVRTVFIIDPALRVRLTMTYPMNVGRGFDEILRVIDALQLADTRAIATPADWRPGGKVIISPALGDEEARERFPQGWNAPRPYLREVDLQETAPSEGEKDDSNA